jgi:hypothetical protein
LSKISRISARRSPEPAGFDDSAQSFDPAPVHLVEPSRAIGSDHHKSSRSELLKVLRNGCRSDTTGKVENPAACFARRVKLTPQKYFSFRKTEFMI